MREFVNDLLPALSIATLAEAAAVLLFIGAVYIGAHLAFGG